MFSFCCVAFMVLFSYFYPSTYLHDYYFLLLLLLFLSFTSQRFQLVSGWNICLECWSMYVNLNSYSYVLVRCNDRLYATVLELSLMIT